MVVPGGPAYGKSVEGHKLEKADLVVGIDPDGQQGVKKVDKTNVIRFLRGPDSVGSHVTVKVSKHDTKELVEFALKRADYRSVEKIKDLYLKMAALNSAAARYKEDYERHSAEARGKPLSADYLKKVLAESLDDFQTIAGELEPVVVSHVQPTCPCEASCLHPPAVPSHAPRGSRQNP